MRKLICLAFILTVILLPSLAAAQCTGGPAPGQPFSGIPFNCVPLPAPVLNDLLYGGSEGQASLGGGKGTGSFTIQQLKTLIGGGAAIPNASLLGGTGSAFTPITLGENLSLSGNVLNATGGGGGSLTFTDGTHTVAGATQLSVTGGTIGGTAPNATLTITGGGGSFLPLTGGTMSGAINSAGIADTGGITTPTLGVSGAVNLGTGGANPWNFSGTTLSLTGAGNPNMVFNTGGTGNINFDTSNGLQFQVVNSIAAAVNSVRVFGSATGGTATLQQVGDAAGSLTLAAGTGGTAGIVKVTAPLQASNYVQIFASHAYVNGTAIAPTSVNQPILWADSNLSGSIDTGGSSPAFFRNHDTVVSPGGQYTDFFHIDQEINAGYDGPLRRAFTVIQNKNAASVSGGSVMNTAVITGVYTGFEGGTGGPVSFNWLGGGVNFNADTSCDIQFANQCTAAEIDSRLKQASAFRSVVNVHFGQFDAAHGAFEDAGLTINASPLIAPGTGRGTNAIQIGGYANGWPLDNTLSATSSIFTVVVNQQGNLNNLLVGGTFPVAYKSGFGFDLLPVNITNYAWRSSGLWIDGAGQESIGPGSITYSTSGLTISSPNVSEVSAVVHSGGAGTNYRVGDEVIDAIGGQWNVATVTGTAPAPIATVTMLRAGFAATCPAAAAPVIGGVGTGATLDITCTASGTTTLGAVGQTVVHLGLATFGASATGGATVNLAQGVAPTSPNNGDEWMTSVGLFYHAGGTTVGPLGAGGGGGNVNTSGTPANTQIAQFVSSTAITGITTSGTGSVVMAASPTVATPTFTGTTTSAGISDTSASGGPSIGGGIGITTTGDLSSTQTIANWAAATSDHKSQALVTTIGTTGTATHVWENFDPQVILNGATTGEINVMHPDLIIGSTGSMVNGEPLEAEFNNSGSTTGIIQSVLAIGINSGTMATAIGYQNIMNNSGSITSYYQFSCNAVVGTPPANDYCLRNSDASSTIDTLGNVIIGRLGTANPARLLEISGQDALTTTFPLVITTVGGPTFAFTVNDAGNAVIGQSLIVGTSGSFNGSVTYESGTSGSVKVTVPNSALTSYTLTLPSAPPTVTGQVLSATTGGTATWVTNGSGGAGCVPAGSANQILLDSGSATCSDSTITLSGAAFTGPSGATAAAVSITGSTATNASAAGGAVQITGGVPGANGVGGAFAAAGGAGGATNAAGGIASIAGGAGAGTGNGGNSNVVGGISGNGATGNGGVATLVGGAATSTNGTGGGSTMTGGLGTGTGNGGAVNMTGGVSGATGSPGVVNITGGAGAAASTSTGGGVNVTGGASGTGATGNGGGAVMLGGTAVSTNGNGGPAVLKGGVGAGTGLSGAAQVLGGISDGTGAAGLATVTGGAGGTGFTINGGAATMTGGASGTGATSNGGASSVIGGAAISTNGGGGAALVTGGIGAGTGSGGVASLTGGVNGATGTPGAASVTGGAGAAASTVDGGAASVSGGTSGTGATGAGGAATVAGGAASSTNGAGGQANVKGGAGAGTGAGGNVVLTPGAAGASGAVGAIQATGLLEFTSGTPTIASGACGTGTNGTIAGTDQTNVITIGAVATTACAVSFGGGVAGVYPAAPKACLFSAGNAAAAGSTVLPFISAISTSGFTLSGAVLASTVFYVHCF